MSDKKREVATKAEGERQRPAALKQAWDAVPQEGGNKGCVLDGNKDTLGILAITEDGTLILKRQCIEDFVVVSREEASAWRISPYNDSQEVRFESVRDLLR